jgi:TRAP-type C4-dicarboxylate transport system permease small subunit
MDNPLQRLDNWLAMLERGITVMLFTALIIILGVNIVTRNILQISFHRLLELAPVLVLWVSLLGAALAVRQQRHIKIELLLRLIPEPWRRRVTALTCMFGMLVSGILVYAAVVFVRQEIQLVGPWGALAVCFPLFFASVFFRLGVQLISRWLSFKAVEK